MKVKPLTILHGTETGNSEDLANQLYDRAKEKNIDATLVGAMDFSTADLSEVQRLIVVISTWGEGDPPSEAEEFCEDLFEGEHDLKHIDFAVCALGDTSYEIFCGCGKQVDKYLEQHGATRFLDRVDLDVDFDDDFEEWSNKLFDLLENAE